ncbi:MAG: PEP-CTERM sorting domain-containing protein [Armatimonadetes bacterium]|nr:PEP-CTERM sorting domain-containing protein [Armatimonadota bacterium]
MRSFVCAVFFGALVTLVMADSNVRGMSLTPWGQNALLQPSSDASIERMKQIGVRTVALNVWWFQDGENSNTISEDFSRYSASEPSVLHAIQKIHSLGMRVLLKPMVDLRNGAWRGTINPSGAWFGGYSDFINHWAEFAASNGVEALSVGCEFNRTESWASSWRSVIAGVRSRYSGALTYSANWDAYASISWWDALDTIGIDAYFPLTNKNDPSLQELQSRWGALSSTLDSWRVGRGLSQRIEFTEVGYRSMDGANKAPWSWGNSGTVDLQEQADCYEALLSTLWDRPWWEGAYWWNWETWPSAGGVNDDGFTPQNKLAEGVVERYYGMVPEPAGALALVLGTGWMLRRRKRLG